MVASKFMQRWFRTKEARIRLYFTFWFLLFSGFLQHIALAENNIKNSETATLHLIGDGIDIKAIFPDAREVWHGVDYLSKEVLSSSFPAYHSSTEVIMDDVASSSFWLIDLSTGQKRVLYRYPDEYLTGMAGGVEGDHVFVSTYRRDYDGKFQIWQLDKKGGKAKMVVEAKSLYFSERCGKLVYVDDKKQLRVKQGEENESIVARTGDFPVIFPNCAEIVFVAPSHGLRELIIYSEKSPAIFTKRTLVSSITKEFDPLIRVSNNSKYVAFRYKSDFAMEPVRVIRTSDGKEIYVSRQVPIKNWFFSD